jgi:AcrR family transcriptional regulator
MNQTLRSAHDGLTDSEPEKIRLEQITHEALCQRILARHRTEVRTQKSHLAVPRLASIITATLKLANRKGFHETSLRDLARESGMSMGGLYSYFESKDTLLLMILGEVNHTVMEVLNSAAPEVTEDARQHLRWLIRTHIELTEKMLPWFAFAYLEAKSFPASAKKAAIESEENVEEIFTDVLQRGVEAGCFSIRNPHMTATLIKPLLQDWYIKRSKFRKRDISPDRYAREVIDFVEAAIAVKQER